MHSTMVPLNAPPVVVSMPEHPPDYAVWSICSFIYGNPCCLGLIALIVSMKSRDQKMVGDMIGAKTYGLKARLLNGIALALIIISIIICIVVSVVMVSVQSSTTPRAYNHHHRF